MRQALAVVGVLAVSLGQACTKPDHPGATRLGEPPQQPPPATAPGASVFDPLVEYVPQDAVAVVAIDLDQTRRSPAASQLVERLLAQTGQEARVTAAGRAGGLDIRTSARALVVAGIPAGPGEELSPLIVVAGPLDEGRAEAQLLAGGGTAENRDADGVTIAIRGASVLIRQDLLVIAPGAALERSIAARAGESAAEAGELRDAVLAVRGGTAGYAAVRMIDDLRALARDVLPDLATAAWFAGSLDVASGVTLTGIGAFPDQATAVRLAGAVQLGKSFGLSELRSADPVAAWAIEKIVATTAGANLRLTATFTTTDALALLALLP